MLTEYQYIFKTFCLPFLIAIGCKEHSYGNMYYYAADFNFTECVFCLKIIFK